jgi:hypothetical protein
MGYKNQTLSEEAYTKQYESILECVPAEVWDLVAAQPEVVLLCFCRYTWFCHSHLVIEHLVGRGPERFQDGRMRAALS